MTALMRRDCKRDKAMLGRLVRELYHKSAKYNGDSDFRYILKVGWQNLLMTLIWGMREREALKATPRILA